MKPCVLLLFVCLLITLVYGAKSLSEEEKQKRMVTNWRMINRFTGSRHLTNIRDEGDFFKEIVRSPRNYSLVILFNSDRSCFACRQIDASFDRVAHAYQDMEDRKDEKSFFLRVGAENMYSVAQKMGITTAPVILVVPPVKKISFPRKRSQKLTYPSSEYEMNEYEITEFLKTKGIEVEGFTKPWDMKSIYIGIAITSVALPFLVLLVQQPRGPFTWFYFFMVTFFLNMSGAVGNLIHDNAWAQYNMFTGEYIFVLQHLQRQFCLEGYIGGFLLVFASFSFITIVEFLPKVNGPWKRRFSFLLLLCLCLLSLNCWMALYCYKNKMYPFHYYFDIFEGAQWFSASLYEFTGIALR